MKKLLKDIISTGDGIPSSMRIITILGVLWVFSMSTYLFIVNEFDDVKATYLITVLVILLGGKVLQHGSEEKPPRRREPKQEGFYDE